MVDLRVDVHKDISNPGWAIANIQVNKGAKDLAAKALPKTGNTGAQKTTHKIETGGPSGSGYVNGEPSMISGQEVGKWEYDPGQKMQKYWDGTIWIFYDEVEKKEKYWDGVAWQWKAWNIELMLLSLEAGKLSRFQNYNEAYNLSQKYLKFNLQEFVRIAVEATSKGGSRRCTEVLKCKESMNNRVYLLTMDNGSVVFAKLPNSSAGPASYTTASEVATCAFLREVLDIPTPRIMAWPARKTNPGGAEYILEERAPGQSLWTLWQDWNRVPMIARFGIIRQVVEIERKLTDTKFKHCGCIYFKEDIPQGDCLYGLEQGAFSRRPHDALDFVRNKAISEKGFLNEHGHPRLNYARSPTEHEQPEEMLELLDQYLELAPAMISPSIPDDVNASTLWHPDLHLDNLFVDPNTLQVTSVIDSQLTAAAPLFYQCGVPKMVRHQEPVLLDLSNWPKWPDDYKDFGQDQKEYAEKMHRSEYLHQYYLRIARRDNPRHWAALQLHDEVRVQPVKIVQQVWENSTIFFLRQALMRIVNNWERLCPDAGPCPVSFSEQDFVLYNHEVEKREFISDTLNLIQKNYGLNPDRTVGPDKYVEIQTELMRLKAICLEATDNEEERFNVEKLWPYQDTVNQPSVATFT
ncbi:hypothetical protein G7Y89_g4304 [Cudoniella acicularis]|uniref:Altered inheritance of mitochondria protein 9, mitochondrial n=1 Tax=Cudoniella acicularis TaxID=354080 RepID=A0A8H4RQJ4_9HELO|nr:hypothetical protein G7Y89_g4304 [Cudoniella acicularis]